MPQEINYKVKFAERRKIFLHRKNTARYFDRAFYDASKRNQNFWCRLLAEGKKLYEENRIL